MFCQLNCIAVVPGHLLLLAGVARADDRGLPGAAAQRVQVVPRLLRPPAPGNLKRSLFHYLRSVILNVSSIEKDLTSLIK